jgi:hypothetical protein
MENNDIDIISNESKNNKAKPVKDEGDEFIAILDEYIKKMQLKKKQKKMTLKKK